MIKDESLCLKLCDVPTKLTRPDEFHVFFTYTNSAMKFTIFCIEQIRFFFANTCKNPVYLTLPPQLELKDYGVVAILKTRSIGPNFLKHVALCIIVAAS